MLIINKYIFVLLNSLKKIDIFFINLNIIAILYYLQC